MKDSETLQNCFSSLDKQLYNIRNNATTRNIFDGNLVIDEIVNKGIFSCDLEDVQQYLYHYINLIKEMISELPAIIRTQVYDDTFTELYTYKNGLVSILNQVEDKMEALGSNRFSNAGFKVRLNLTNLEIASLFYTLLEAGVIRRDNCDGTTLSNKKLADFISKNFDSKKPEPGISKEDIYNHLKKNPKEEQTIDKLLTKMIKIISH